MRDAIVITFTLILLFVLLGYMYNLMQPYFVKLGVIEKQEEPKAEKSDGGIFRSRDFGRSWEQSSQVEGGDALSKSDIFRLEISPDNPQVLFAASSIGLYMSQNSAESWKNFLPEEIAEKEEAITSFAIDPKNTARMYAASYSDKKGGRILKTKGVGFYSVYSASPADRVLGLWVDAYDPSTIYAGTLKGLFLESKDFGESWRIKREFQGAVHKLVMVPSDTRIMYLAADGRVVKTSNQGKDWQDISPSIWATYDADFLVHDLRIDPYDEKAVYVATSKGLFRSKDGGGSFEALTLPVSGEAPLVTSIYLAPYARELLFAGGKSQVYKSDDAGETWQIQPINTERFISVIVVKPDDTRTIFAGAKR